VKASLLVLSLIFTGALAAQSPAEGGRIVVPEGTDVKMKTLEALSSKTARVGNPVALEVTENVVVNGKLIVPRGSKGHGEVSLVKKNGIAGKAGDLVIRPTYVRVGDLKIELRGATDTEGASKHAEAITLAAISGVGIFKKGNQAEAPVGTQVIGIVIQDTTIAIASLPTVIPSYSPTTPTGKEPPPSPALKKTPRL